MHGPEESTIRSISHPFAYFESAGLVEKDGFLGNELFYDERTIVIDLKQDRFGILSRATSPLSL